MLYFVKIGLCTFICVPPINFLPIRVPVPAVLEEAVLQRPPRLHLLRRVPAHRALLLAVRVDGEHALVTLENKMLNVAAWKYLLYLYAPGTSPPPPGPPC